MTSRDFRISARTRTKIKYYNSVFQTGNNLNLYYKQAQEIAYKYNQEKSNSDKYLTSADINASAILHNLYQNIISKYILETNTDFFTRLTPLVKKNYDAQKVFAFFSKEFPSPLLSQQEPDITFFTEETTRGFFVHNVMNYNPAMLKSIKPLICPKDVVFPEGDKAVSALMGGFIDKGPQKASIEDDLFTFLITPARLNPDSLFDQINYILTNWEDLLTEDFKINLLKAIDYHNEETKPIFNCDDGSPIETYVPEYDFDTPEIEAFTKDRQWMPNVIMIAKSTLVWLSQLSKYYKKPITRLDQIPNQELDNLKNHGFTALWLIGLWERSDASKQIKNLCGNPEAEASAYSLKNDQIADSIGGWAAIEDLRTRCSERGIRLAADMVPNHTGIDGEWVINHPEYFIQQDTPPFPSYTYDGPDLSTNSDIEIKLEDHYYTKTDAAVTFKRVDKRTGETSYIYHGNDGTSMPWNDTAQLDFLNPITREAVFQQIRHVAINFPIIRFDAAMTLAKKHIQRLWYPKPGTGGDIAGRTQNSMSTKEFNNRIPKEFWREVVDRMAAELPDTLLLAEAFWMMEGYFVRTLGMHRVYNSAFMNMLKNQENKKYKDAIKATIEFEPEILKRYVNFMSNPDEDTAIGQFGDGDKYFGVCTLLSTMPGLPMFGHGQIEGLKEKYGMEYRKAYWDEWPSQNLIEEHQRRIFPLLKKRYLFSGVENFQLYDLINNNNVNNSTFCYSNGTDEEKAVVFYNNQYDRVSGYIKNSSLKINKTKKKKDTTTIAENLGLRISGKRFLIYKNFNNGLTYLIPSLKVFEEGLWVQLNGFETQVLLDIREIEDTDGTYSKLYAILDGNGVSDLKLEIRALRLRPLFKEMNVLRTPAFVKLLEIVMSGETKNHETRKIILQLAQSYSRLPYAIENMSEETKALLPAIPKEINPSNLLKSFEKFSKLFEENELLSNSSIIMEELVIISSGALFILPFLKEEITVKKVNMVCEKLLIPHFYSTELKSRGFANNNAIHVSHGISIFLTSYKLMEENKKDNFKALFENQEIRDYVLCNEYQGITWYKKEAMQELIILSGLSKAVFSNEKFEISKYISDLMDREISAKYQLNVLLEK